MIYLNGANCKNTILRIITGSIIITTLFISLSVDHNVLVFGNEGNNTFFKANGLKGSILTFSVNGIIAGLIFTDISHDIRVVPPDILSGHWHLYVKEGNVTEFLANFSMVRINGLAHHVVQINNFHRYPDLNAIIRLDVNDSSSSIMGLADVKIDNFTNREVNAVIMINRLSAIVISLSPISNTGVGNDIFRAKPITGIVNSFQKQR